MSIYNINRINYPQTPAGYEDDTADTHYVPAPCQVACPVGTDAPSYMAYIWEGNYRAAFEAITATNPFSSICGRVCDAPCERSCRRGASDGSVMIRSLKRYVMDKVGNDYDLPPVPVSKKKTIGIVGAGPAGLTAAHDLCVAGYEVHVYEMSDRPGGMMVWGIPGFRMPAKVIQQDIDRLTRRCAGLKIHLNTELGSDISLEEIKHRHDAVLFTIGARFGKPMGIPGEDHPQVVDGVGFLRRINGGERPQLPETVVVVGGGDVAMDACRAAKRMPGCENVKVVYRRGPDEIPARKTELDGAAQEGIELIYFTRQLEILTDPDTGLILRCVKTELGKKEDDGRRGVMLVDDSGHDIPCGMVIAAVGQTAICDELENAKMIQSDRIRTDFNTMRTSDPQVFAAGDGAFGGSSIVMAMHHGQKAAYYIKAFLEDVSDPVPYRTPYRTRRVPLAQDVQWETLPVHEPGFLGLGDNPVEFTEVETTYSRQQAKDESARCYRCDAETGSADFSVSHREDLFSMARTDPSDFAIYRKMLEKRLQNRSNPFPEESGATLDDLTFLPANLSRLVIDPYREACKVETTIGNKLILPHPLLATGFDDAPEEVFQNTISGLVKASTAYIGVKCPGDGVPWLQLITPGDAEPTPQSRGLIYPCEMRDQAERVHSDQVLGLLLQGSDNLFDAIPLAHEKGFDMILLNGFSSMSRNWVELEGTPDLTIVRDTIHCLRQHKIEGDIDIVYFGGVRSGTDAAKLIAMGCTAVVIAMPIGLATGGKISGHELQFSSNYSREDRISGVVNLFKSFESEASMMARCTGKTRLESLEPEDLRSITLASSSATGILLAGSQ